MGALPQSGTPATWVSPSPALLQGRCQGICKTTLPGCRGICEPTHPAVGAKKTATPARKLCGFFLTLKLSPNLHLPSCCLTCSFLPLSPRMVPRAPHPPSANQTRGACKITEPQAGGNENQRQLQNATGRFRSECAYSSTIEL